MSGSTERASSVWLRATSGLVELARPCGEVWRVDPGRATSYFLSTRRTRSCSMRSTGSAGPTPLRAAHRWRPRDLGRCWVGCEAGATRGSVAPLSPGTTLLAVGGFTLSFAALRDLAVRVGMPADLAWLWPLLIDGMIVEATLAVVAMAQRGSRRAGVVRLVPPGCRRRGVGGLQRRSCRDLGSWVGWCGGGLGAAGGAPGHHPFDGAAHGRP